MCEEKIGTITHILAECRVALSQGRCKWRHDKVLRQISEQVAFHCNGRVNPCKNKMDREVQGVEFIPAGKRRPVAESRKDQGTSGFRCAQRSPGLDSDVGPGSGFLDTAKISPGNHRNSSKA